MAKNGQEVGIADFLTEASEEGAGVAIAFSGAGEQLHSTVKNSFAEVSSRVRHDRARCDSIGIICSVLFLLWGRFGLRCMKRFITVPTRIALRWGWLGNLGGFLPFPVLPDTISGQVGAVLARFPAMRALFTGGGVGIYKTGIREL